MSLIDIYNSNGDKLSDETLDMFGLQLLIPSPSYTVQTEKIEGRSGVVVLDKTLEPRSLTARFFTKSRDYEDSLLLRDELYSILMNGHEIYVSESKLKGKRWKVFPDGWTPERINQRVLQFEIPLTAYLGLAESIGTTLDELTFDNEKWQVGQGLALENPIYVHQTNTFKIFNAGDVEVDPRYFPLKIEFKGASSNLQIKNLTTGDSWAYTGSTGINDTITLDGIRSLKNGESVFGQTNKKVISIVEGWNDFELTGATNFLISFDFRFYYY